ncbi:MAG: carboxypeptidase regulatory-like domain-containing protein [Bacteroidetes bacterium]|nr:MAG: carboxypeptidase regulatory-like domain-containing protein [Bacteroidota bacterium]MBL1144013.1 carboxypeptidase regulatory-like domain-containing protein [Bacteroidota bacterium]NOG56814.1 carboxypeptidase regulatory-like domain-containing protein [Bacteroidota bacterium]
MKNFRNNVTLMMSAIVVFAFSISISSCNKDDETETPKSNTPSTTTSAEEDAVAISFTTNNNTLENPGILSANTLIPTNTLSTGELPPLDGFYTQVNYKGAFGSTNWAAGWTYISGDKRTFDNTKPTKKINDNSLTINTTLSKDTIYIIDGLVFIGNGETLTIEKGTVLKGKPGSGASASALIIAKGGIINAIGTATEPIIMTYEGDDGTPQLSNVKGQWGGLILLGNARLNSSPGSTQIEGIPTNEPRGIYGGADDSDNSGTIKYVSIRHGGTDIGAGNEINGLTLGGVGSGTTIEYIEVVSNKDDGLEFFGGAPNAKHIITAFCGDDSFDYDEGFRGKGQFWVTVQDEESDRGGEHDGGTDPETATPYATPVIYNVTYIGNGTSRAITFRDNAGGEYHNSIFYNFGKGIDIEDLTSGEDSYSRFVNSDLKLKGNIFYEIGSGTTAYDIFTIAAQ